MSTQADLFDTGDTLKEKGMARAIRNSNDEWKDMFLIEATSLANTGQPFTSEDVTERIGQPPLSSPNAVGAMMNAAVRRLRLHRVGLVKAQRINQHSAMLSKWQM